MQILRIPVLALLLAGASSLAFGHYHWSYFAHNTAPYQDMPLKYDLNTLQDKTISFFISKSGPAKLVDGDSFPSLVSQIRRAAETWNAVPSSALRVQFGGLVDFPEKQPTAEELVNDKVTPSIEVYFDDEMSPGVLALTWPETRQDLSYLAAEGTKDTPNPGFAPLLKARLQLRSDLAASKQASYSDDFFLTIVHEFGHTLGLQHSTSSAAMSTAITRGTSKPKPLSADDIAGISWLYPRAYYPSTVGSIAGHITSESQDLNLASVVALSTNGTAINAMTNPDGTYKIDGLPPGEYLLYAHPLPPAQLGEALPAAIYPQTVVDGKTLDTPFQASTGFETRFFPGTKEWTEAAKIVVKAGETVAGMDMDLPRTSASGVYNLPIYGYLPMHGNPLDTADAMVAVHAPPLLSGNRYWMAFKAPGTIVAGTQSLVPNLRLSVIGGPANLEQDTLQYWAATDDYILIVGGAGVVTAATPIAIAVNTDAGLYVLPAAFSVVPAAHPVISKVSDAGLDGASAKIEGANLDASTRVLFDGVDAISVHANDDGSLIAVAPPALGTQTTTIEAFTTYGQTSNQLLGDGMVPAYSYTSLDDASILSSLGEVTPGTNTMLRIDGVNTDFIAEQNTRNAMGQTAVGFGSSEFLVQQLWVVSPNQLLLNVAINSSAKAGPVDLTVATGLQVVTLPAAVQVHPVSESPLNVQAPILNLVTGLSGAPGGGVVVLRVSNLPDDLSGWRVTIGGIDTKFVRTGPGELQAEVPSLDPGVVPVQVISSLGRETAPVLLQVDSAPPLIMLISVENDASLNHFPLAKAGSRIWVNIETVGADPAAVTADMFRIRVGDVVHTPDELKRIGQTGIQLGVILSSKVPADTQQPLTVGLGTRVSMPRTLAIGQ